MAKGKFDPNAITEIILRATGGEVGAASALAPKVYVIFNPHSYSHLFNNKINTHTTYMHKCSNSLYIVHTYLTHEPQRTARIVPEEDRRGHQEEHDGLERSSCDSEAYRSEQTGQG